MLRPAVIIRRKALYSGVLGNSTVWKGVAVWVFGKAIIKKAAGKNLEVIDVSALGPGRFMTIETIKPTSRRARRKLDKRGTPAPTVKAYRATSRAEAAAIREHRRSQKR
jgi:tRNA U54 and U55 pseudouridine synthase Pus10